VSVASRCNDFTRDYEIGQAEALIELERAVLGVDYGATSWTTREEAARFAQALGLRPGMRLLDVGSGSGWPGLFLAASTGCDAVLSDVPATGLRVAARRAAADGLAGRCEVVQASAAALPFAAASFDAISHCDVLCCLPAKLEALRSCRRVAKDGARMAFSVISIAPGLGEDERRRAVECGPPCVEGAEDYAALLREAGWAVLECTDVTAAFASLIETSLAHIDRKVAAFQAALGEQEFADRVLRRRNALKGVHTGLLRRECFVSSAA